MKPTMASSTTFSRARAASAPCTSPEPSAQRCAGDAADRLDDVVGAGRPQPFLAAEMIGDRADIGFGGRGDLARRRAVEALPAEQLQRGADKGGARLVGGRRLRAAEAWIWRVL